MSPLLKSMRLSCHVTREVRSSYSILGIFAIVCGMAGVVLATLFTKGRVASSKVAYLSNPSNASYHCNSTLIYPGQLIGSVEHNAYFQYQALSQFAYKGETLGNCTVTNPTYITVVGPPLTYPTMTINQTVTCNMEGSQVPVDFAVNQLLYWGYVQRVASIDVGGTCIKLLGSFNANTGSKSIGCYNQATVAYRIDENLETIAMYPENTTDNDYCPYSLTDFPEATNLIGTVKSAILSDWNTTLTTLPDLLYPCVPREKIWAPFWSVLWDILTAMSAWFGTLLTVVLVVIRRLEEGDRADRAPSPSNPVLLTPGGGGSAVAEEFNLLPKFPAERHNGNGK
ncbi:hypothetical protein DL93DRAFT_1991178 [Clavulina sp. PMI_390]|nr:hypothetical protein DL93DRAFT_1991178 [Clavulina sp. PMI_390]